MEDNYGSRSGIVRQHSGIWISLRDGDFEEEEVWDVLKDRDAYGYGISKSNVVTTSSSSPIAIPRCLPTAARMIPMAATSSNNSSTSNSHETAVVLQQSAPVSIPDWSKIYRTNKKKDVSRFDDVDDNDEEDEEDEGEEEEEEEEEDDDDEFDPKVLVPPHELIARRLARSHISSFSVFEGVGRTLKGRDLSKVRNAVLTKTGFLESL